MKNLIVIILFFLKAIFVNAQINLEYTYTGNDVSENKRLFATQLEVSGSKYVCVNANNGKITFYNLDHSVYKSILLSMTVYNVILYVSEHLFDLDDGIEYLFLSGNLPAFIKVMDEDGTVLWSESDCGRCFISADVFPGSTTPIVNTDSGTKMIIHVEDSLGNGGLSKIKVYSLSGTLSTAIAEGNGQLMQGQGGQGQLINLYPNPSSNSATLQYQLPKGEQQGEIVLYNTQGAEVKRYKVDNTFKDVLLDNTMLPTGTYFYQLQTAKGSIGTKKMVIVR